MSGVIQVRSPWPIALAAVGIYALGSLIFSSSDSKCDHENATEDTSAPSLRKRRSPTDSGSGDKPGFLNGKGRASGKNAAGAHGGGDGSNSSDKGEGGDAGKEQRKNSRLDSLPIRDPRLNKSTVEDLLETDGKRMLEKLTKQLEGRDEGKKVWDNDKFCIDACRTFGEHSEMKSWRLQVNGNKDKKLDGLKGGRGTHATLFEGKIDVKNKPSLEDWREEILDTFNKNPEKSSG